MKSFWSHRSGWSGLGRLLRERGLTLATAESCTGGLVGSLVTDVPGSSHYYCGGVVAYSNEVKVRLLGVRRATLKRYGAVSAQTATEMAEGVRNRTGADIGVAVTGIAGPGGGTRKKPVGLVYIAIAAGASRSQQPERRRPKAGFGTGRPRDKSLRAEVRSQAFRFKGDRKTIRRRAAAAALALVMEVLSSGYDSRTESRALVP